MTTTVLWVIRWKTGDGWGVTDEPYPNELSARARFDHIKTKWPAGMNRGASLVKITNETVEEYR